MFGSDWQLTAYRFRNLASIRSVDSAQLYGSPIRGQHARLLIYHFLRSGLD